MLLFFFYFRTKTDWDKDSNDLRTKLSLSTPVSSDIFPKAWWTSSPAAGEPMYYLVTGDDSFTNQKPASQTTMLWHKGKAMKVIPTSTLDFLKLDDKYSIITLFNSWECDMAKLAHCQECDKLHITLSETKFQKMFQNGLFWPEK